MALEPAIITAHEGDVYCRQANGLDVAKFFLFNYGLHALTVITEPGSGALETTFAVFQAVLYPYAGMSVALSTIYRGARFKGTPLQQAKRAGALCMAVHATDAGHKFICL
jgi:hypothetical protein